METIRYPIPKMPVMKGFNRQKIEEVRERLILYYFKI